MVMAQNGSKEIFEQGVVQGGSKKTVSGKKDEKKSKVFKRV
jgi:hypothetical protein